MTAMTLLLIPLSLVGLLSVLAIPGIIALTIMAGPLYVFAQTLAAIPDISSAENSVNILIKLMTAMTLLLVILSPVAPLALIAVGALSALTVLIMSIGGLAVAIGWLMEHTDGLEGFLDTGIGILNKLCYAIGSFVGNLIKGFSETVLSIIPSIGQALTDFAVAVTPFNILMRCVDESVLDGVKILAKAIMLLSIADFVNGIASLFGSGLVGLGLELSMFMIALTPFLIGAKSIDPLSAAGVKLLSEAILTLTEANLLNGIKLFKGTSLAEFGEEIAAFGPCMKTFADSVSKIGPSSLEKMKAAAEAGKILADMAKSLPNSGGLLGRLVGENDMDTFGEQLEGFGECLVKYGNKVSEIDESKMKAIEDSIKPAEDLAKVADAIPNTGGFLKKVVGDNDMATFGSHLLSFGNCLNGYAGAVAELNTEAIGNSIKPAEDLIKVADTIPNSGGALGAIVGNNDIDEFGDKMRDFGDTLVEYGDIVAEMNAAAIFNSKTAATTLIGLIGRLEGVNPDNAKNFKPKPIGEGLKDYYDKISAINMDDLLSSVTVVNRLITLFNNMKFIDSSGVDKFKGAVSNLGTTSFDNLTSSFSGAASRFTSIGGDLVNALSKGVLSGSNSINTAVNKIISNVLKTVTSKNQDLKNAGSKLMNQFTVGIKLKASNAAKAVKTPLNNTVTAIRNYYTKFKNAGSYVVDGFCKGISENTWKAESRATVMSHAAIDAAKQTLQQNSPSKVFIDIGSGVVEGFVKGIDDNVSSARASVTNMANESTNTFKRAISKVNDIISGDVELDPVIRPVLDMSNVESGMNSINTMFSKNPAFRTNTNLNAISTMMNRRNQNGVNADVVKAIDKLGKELGSLDRTSYTINGVTYTEGDSVTDAIRTIVRAATREGRA